MMEISAYVYSVKEFEAEARYIEALIWDTLAVRAGERVLICGYGDEARAVRGAIERGAIVTVLESRDRAIALYADLNAQLMRGSTSVIPAREGSFELALAYHYLHEVDPLFHSQILGELARVASRVAIVEPSPPSDALGKRITTLYSQAKREAGLFERYHNLDHWKRLLQGVKAEIHQHTFAFGKVPPPEYLRDTVALLLDTMRAEEAPESIIDELHDIAGRSDAQILPPVRNVLVGAAVGDLPDPIFTARPPLLERALALAAGEVKAASSEGPPPAARAEAAAVTEEAGYEFPPVIPPPEPPPSSRAPGVPPGVILQAQPSFIPPPGFSPPPTGFGPPQGSGFGLPQPLEQGAPDPNFGAPFPAPFAMPNAANSAPDPALGWQWEPPDATKGTTETEKPPG